MKSGTSWIYDYLNYRQDVLLPKGVKETFYFDRHWSKGVGWYKKHFLGTSESLHRVTEVAPSYFHDDNVPSRILSDLGDDVILIIVARDPVRRSWSHYLHLRRYGYTSLDIKSASKLYPEILEASKYKERARLWERYFGSNIKYLSINDLKKSPKCFAMKLCDHMKIDYIDVPSELYRKSNEATSSRNPSLAFFVNNLADKLRSNRLYFIVNFAKKIGLKSYVFGVPSSIEGDKPSIHELAWLESVLEDQEIIIDER